MVDGHEREAAPPGTDMAIPVLTVSDVEAALDFYRLLGFDQIARYDNYVILSRRGAELHLTEWDEHDPERTAGVIHLRTPDVDDLYTRLRDELEREGCLYLAPATGLTAELTADLEARLDRGERLVRLHEIADKPWGTRQFAVIDPSGNAVHVSRRLVAT